MKHYTAFVILLFIAPIALSCSASGFLLAVDKSAKNGSLVKFSVSAVPGKGRVFVTTDPVVGTDVQVSLKIAKSIAEQITGKSGYDYYYYFGSSSPSLVGLSGGAGILGYTISAIDCVKPGKVVATGIINPDGTIGPVAGIPEKISVAPANYMVLVPYLNYNSSMNATPIRDAYDVAYYFTGRNFTQPAHDYSSFNLLMRQIAEKMLNQTQEMGGNSTGPEKMLRERRYYTSASLSFQQWVEQEKKALENKTKPELQNISDSYSSYLIHYPDISTQEDAEIYIIYRERLDDGFGHIDNWTNASDLAYGIERLKTAEIWRSMLGKLKSKKLDESPSDISRRSLETARVYFYYIYNIAPSFTNTSYRYLKKAEDLYNSGDYWLSTSYSIKSMSYSMFVMESMTVENLTDYLPIKREIVKRKMGKSFISWNYAQLAEFYENSDPVVSLLYYDYALGFSSLFPETKKHFPWMLVFGFAIVIKMLYDKIRHVRNN